MTNATNYTAYITVLNELSVLADRIPTLRRDLEDAPMTTRGGYSEYRFKGDESTAYELSEAVDRYNELIEMLDRDERFSEDNLGDTITMGDKYFDLQDKLTRD